MEKKIYLFMVIIIYLCGCKAQQEMQVYDLGNPKIYVWSFSMKNSYNEILKKYSPSDEKYDKEGYKVININGLMYHNRNLLVFQSVSNEKEKFTLGCNTKVTLNDETGQIKKMELIDKEQHKSDSALKIFDSIKYSKGRLKYVSPEEELINVSYDYEKSDIIHNYKHFDYIIEYYVKYGLNLLRHSDNKQIYIVITDKKTNQKRKVLAQAEDLFLYKSKYLLVEFNYQGSNYGSKVRVATGLVDLSTLFR